jgi:uncharacterized protein involved in exopolysaccharide biosynthesis
MQDKLNSNFDNGGIDIGELFKSLWAYKFFIVGICLISIIWSGNYALNADKKFTATAIFKLYNPTNNNGSFSSDLSQLSRIIGSTKNVSSLQMTQAQINGRIFIEKIDKKLKFQSDPFFNSYNPNADDPIWKSIIKDAIGWQKSSANIKERIWQGINKNYLRSIFLEQAHGDAIKLSVTHVNALRAAEIANVIMDVIISSSNDKKNNQMNDQLSYLSNALAKALDDLEMSQSKLKVFAIENSALPLENFATKSLQLDVLREQLSRTTELLNAVVEVSLMLKNGTTKQANYMSLREKHPIVDQVEFRRVLGQNEIISFWSWPETSSVAAVRDTLSERKNRLQTQIDTSQKSAERSGQALEVYAQLEREAKIAEATYTVLIEQVKAQSMIAGYQPIKTEIYEYAYPPISPSAPNRSLILTLGAVMGFLLGSTLALILASTRGVYYTKKYLTMSARAKLNISSRTLTPLRNKSLSQINTQIKKKPRPVLRDIAVEIYKNGSTQVVITSSQAKMKASDLAQVLALSMQSTSTKIAVIDFSNTVNKLSINHDRDYSNLFVDVNNEGNVFVLRPKGDLAAIEMISQKDFLENIKLLNSSFGLILLCADNGDAISLLRALEGQKAFHLTLARTKYTKSDNLQSMRLLLPFQGLIHD